MINVIAFLIAVGLFIAVLDRLRQVNWRTVKPLVMATYVGFAVWPLGLAQDAAYRGIETYQFAGMLAQLCWLLASREDWQRGAPEHIKTDFGKLGDPGSGT